MSADLRLSDLMDPSIKNPDTPPSNTPTYEPEENAAPAKLSWRAKILMGAIITTGLVGGIVWALILTAPERPDVDTTGKTMNIVIDDQPTETDGTNAELAKKLADPNVITNYFEEHPPAKAEHPLDPLLVVAKNGLKHIREHVQDYTCIFHKQERIGRSLATKEVIECKIRHNGIADGNSQSPMSVYIKFLEPSAVRGREVIWQKGRNNDKLTVHEYVFGRNVQLNLPPNGMLAMRGNRYPMTEIGLETLILRMIEKGERDRKHGECEVTINRSVKINDRDCTMIKIVHPEQRDHFEFHIAEIFIDDELNVPIRYSAFTWPKKAGGEPVLEEQYTLADLKLNVNLTDLDFDYRNPKYKFPNK